MAGKDIADGDGARTRDWRPLSQSTIGPLWHWTQGFEGDQAEYGEKWPWSFSIESQSGESLSTVSDHNLEENTSDLLYFIEKDQNAKPVQVQMGNGPSDCTQITQIVSVAVIL